MPPVVSSTGSSGHTSAASAASLTFAHTSNGDPLYVFIEGNPPPASFAVTYGGVPLTRLVTGTLTVRFEVHVLAAPTPGTADVVITPSASAFMTAGAFNVSGVDLDRPAQGLTFASGTSTTPSVTVPSAVGDLVIAMVLTGSPITFTPGAGQTGIWAQNGVNTHQSAGSAEPGAASVVMSSSLSGSSSWWTAGFSIPADGTIPDNVARLSKTLVEVLQSQSVNPTARLSKTLVEVLQRQSVSPTARLSKTLVEVFVRAAANPGAGGETVRVIWQ